nr:NST-like protein [Parasacculina yatsui]
MEEFRAAVESGARNHPRSSDTVIEYGTAGFRILAKSLDHVMFRMGLLATLRSKSKHGAAVGLMITASHNPVQDNGVKLVDPQGEMLDASWEPLASGLANVGDEFLWAKLVEIVQQENVDFTQKAAVIVARDNRPSGEELLASVLCGVNALSAECRDLGVTTTPLLHFMVHAANTADQPPCLTLSPDLYYHSLSSAFKCLNKQSSYGDYSPRILVDGANGVGAGSLAVLAPLLGNSLHVNVFNETGQLNHQCGADYVKVQQCAPLNAPLTPLARCASMDGDADRIIYFFLDEQKRFHMLDGDKIATLVAGYLKELLEATGVEMRLGLVQTAYANGNSTKYISQQLCVPVSCVATGVKHLHRRAVQYDIGVYFEANGHGTVVFSSSALQQLKEVADSCSDTSRQCAAGRLVKLSELINQTVGDAVSDMLLVETILRARGWSVQQWHDSYSDLPCRQLKIVVPDRNMFTTTDAERKCVTPAGLQQDIDALVDGYTCGRSFVRPSGTENVVRVYAEADTQENADRLAAEVAKAVEARAK